jgi:RND superfamily putative drug exporter
MDATLVRLILVPAFMHVMGGANWWAPGVLVRLHNRIGISEDCGGRFAKGRHRAADPDRPAQPVQA